MAHYAEELARQFFYSGFNGRGHKGRLSYYNNQFFSYNACIGVVLKSQKQKNFDGGPKYVFLLTECYHSATTAKHKYALLSECPGDFEEFYEFPLGNWAGMYGSGNLPSIKTLAENLYNKVISASKSPMTSKEQRKEFEKGVAAVERWRKHFGTEGTPATYARHVRKWTKLFADEEAYAAYVKETRKKLALATKNANKRRIEEAQKQERKRQRDEENARRERETKRTATYHIRKPLMEVIETMVQTTPQSLISIYGSTSQFVLSMMKEVHKCSRFTHVIDMETQTFLKDDICTKYKDSTVDDYVTPAVAFHMNCDTGNIEVVVDHESMMSGRQARVKKTDVLKFLAIRERGEKLLGLSFTSGYRFVMPKKANCLTVGCHNFSNTVVDALNTFLKENDNDSIERQYRQLADKLTELCNTIKQMYEQKDND